MNGVYEILALRYAGPFEGSGALLMWLRDWDVVAQRCYYIWCIRSEKETIVVDTGVSPERAGEMNLAGYVNPVEMLSRIDVDARQVKHVILTHIHWDHVSGVKLFPKATFYVQQREFRFWIEDPIARRPPLARSSDTEAISFLASLEGSERLVLLDGDCEIMPGIECLLSPGHTVALQAVAVETAKGTAIVGSDCAHLFRNFREEWPSAIITNLVDWLKTYERLKATVSEPELLFPGHDPLLTESYPKIADGITKLV
jgi:glyoxylase-like metal-dependent hydrolase (beta-lactamase superfamily II)